jgi:hypothetical protein
MHLNADDAMDTWLEEKCRGERHSKRQATSAPSRTTGGKQHFINHMAAQPMQMHAAELTTSSEEQ